MQIHRYWRIGNENPMLLAGVGMRKKNLYILQVDVYLVGVSASVDLLKKVRGMVNVNLADQIRELVSSCDEGKQNVMASQDYCDLSITLKFQRQVSRQQILLAFVEAFEGCSPAAISIFQNAIGDVIGSSDLNLNDELTFDFTRSGRLTISKLNGSSSSVVNKEVFSRLLVVYLDSKKSVCPELVECINKQLPKITSDL